MLLAFSVRTTKLTLLVNGFVSVNGTRVFRDSLEEVTRYRRLARTHLRSTQRGRMEVCGVDCLLPRWQ
jgi:hypothetical protein